MTDLSPMIPPVAANRYRPLDAVLVFICMIIIPSAVFQSLIGLDEKSSFAIFAPIAAFIALLLSRFRLGASVPVVISGLTVIGGLASLVAGAFSQMLMAATLALAAIIGRALYESLAKPKVLRTVTWFTLLMLIGGLGGILYSLLGGPSLLDVQVGYRTTSLYLTTFSFATIGNIIRPSGIFDEPGALSMYVAIVTMFNDTLGVNRKLNLMLVFLLLFSGSLAGVVTAGLYMILSNSMRYGHRKRFILIAALVGAYLLAQAVFPNNPITATLDTFYGERFKIIDGRLAGDNRSNQVDEFFSLVDEEMLLQGAKNAQKEYIAYDVSSNPFSITYGYGLIISIPYFALLAWLAWLAPSNGFRNSYTALGLMFLLIQRPYIYHMSWSISITAVVWLLYLSRRNYRHLGAQV